jgi:hypothetical protein
MIRTDFRAWTYIGEYQHPMQNCWDQCGASQVLRVPMVCGYTEITPKNLHTQIVTLWAPLNTCHEAPKNLLQSAEILKATWSCRQYAIYHVHNMSQWCLYRSVPDILKLSFQWGSIWSWMRVSIKSSKATVYSMHLFQVRVVRWQWKEDAKYTMELSLRRDIALNPMHLRVSCCFQCMELYWHMEYCEV